MLDSLLNVKTESVSTSAQQQQHAAATKPAAAAFVAPPQAFLANVFPAPSSLPYGAVTHANASAYAAHASQLMDGRGGPSEFGVLLGETAVSELRVAAGLARAAPAAPRDGGADDGDGGGGDADGGAGQHGGVCDLCGGFLRDLFLRTDDGITANRIGI